EGVAGPGGGRGGTGRPGGVGASEADSWLTLWGAVAGFRLGRLPAASLVPPALRYPLNAGRPSRLRPWQRAAGIAQMVVIAGALTRRRPPRALARTVAVVQMGALIAGAVGYSAANGPTPHDVSSPRVGDAQADRSLREPAP